MRHDTRPDMQRARENNEPNHAERSYDMSRGVGDMKNVTETIRDMPPKRNDAMPIEGRITLGQDVREHIETYVSNT